MPQLFQVLRCFKCLVFQVHQTKKSNKWECKLCGEKQSIKRHYGIGTAKDCRIHVQKLNGVRGEIDELKCNKDDESDKNENEYYDFTQNTKENTCPPIKVSKWSNYIEETESLEDSNENMSFGDAEVVLEMPKKKRKQYYSSSKRVPKEISTIDYKNLKKNDKIVTPDTPLIEADSALSIKSKICQPDLLSGDLTIKNECLNVSKQSTKSKYVPPVLNNNSKWAEYTEDAEERDDTDVAPSTSIALSQKNTLFSLCDESELDNVLNI